MMKTLALCYLWDIRSLDYFLILSYIFVMVFLFFLF